MAVILRDLGQVDDAQQLLVKLKLILSDLEDQLNQRAQIYVQSGGRLPAGLQKDDVLFIVSGGNIAIGIKESNKGNFTVLTAGMLGAMEANGTNFIGRIEGTIAMPTVAEFPNENDWGFYYRTTTGATYLTYNTDGTNVLTVQLT